VWPISPAQPPHLRGREVAALDDAQCVQQMAGKKSSGGSRKRAWQRADDRGLPLLSAP
jgi:hypothetical protein